MILPRLLLQNPPVASAEAPNSSTMGSSPPVSPPTTDDHVVLSSAAKDLLVACVYRGVRVGGLREQLRWAGLTSDGGGRVDAFPYLLWPDTPAGHQVAQGLHLAITRGRR